VATVSDVARLAGVSISTVSYTLSGKRSIGAATRARVEAAVRQLNYRPNAGARMLAGTRTHILALSAPMHADTHPPAFMSFVVAIITAARAFDYDLILLTETDPLEGLRRVAASRLVDGIIMMDVSTNDTRIPLLRELGLPVTIIGVPHDTAGLTCVDFDFERAAELAIEHLVTQGHREIGMVGHSAALYARGSNFAPRFRDAFLAAGHKLGISVAFQTSDSTSANDPIADLHHALTAMTALVFDCNEGAHHRVLNRLAQIGISIPGDLSVVSACSSFSTDEFVPPLDVIPLSIEASGRRSVELMMEKLDGDTTFGVELIAPVYVVKGSTV
jgi:DNA-binding LacI/PurR family transcriptional regulator